MFSIILSVKFENVSLMIYTHCVYTLHTLSIQNLLYTHLCVYTHPIYTHFLPILVLIYSFIIILLFIIIYLLIYYILLLLFFKSNIKTILKDLNREIMSLYQRNNLLYEYFNRNICYGGVN
jgi:hypothetical protein